MVKSYSLTEILEQAQIDLPDVYRKKLDKEIEDYDLVLAKLKNNVSSYEIRITELETKGEKRTIAENKSIELMNTHLDGMIKKFEDLMKLRQSKIDNFNNNVMGK